jgi:SAM-dependent methyltransferase
MTLQVGKQVDQSVIEALDLPFLVKTSATHDPGSALAADAAFLPFSAESFATVILPHVLERHNLPHQVLREAHRVLMSEGHIVVTGFNPVSLMGLQRLLRSRAVARGRYYTVGRVIDWLQLLGFEIVASSMFQYAPLFKNARFQRAFQFLESVGDRWLPVCGGGYMITAKKRDVGTNVIGRVRFQSRKPKLASTAAAQSSARKVKKKPHSAST